MSSVMPPVPHKAQVVDKQGVPTAILSDWLKQLLNRIGGNKASTNDELQATLTANAPYLVPTGGMIDFGGTAAPTGWLLCDGSSYLRTDYPALFAVIGTAYGAIDGTHFSVPPAGVFMVNKNSGTFTPVGATGGAETAALPNHAHSVSITSSGPSATGGINVAAGSTQMPLSTHTHAVSGNTGNPLTNPNIATLPPYAVANRLIKT